MDKNLTTMIHIYTDGSCEPNPGPGGWSAILVLPGGVEIELQGSERYTTNNRMEFTAAFAGMNWMDRNGQSAATIHSDSQLLVNTMETWVWGWERKGFRKARKNLDIIQPMHDLRKRLTLHWRWVRGHNGHHYNERADRLAEHARVHCVRHPVPLLPESPIQPELIHMELNERFDFLCQ